MTDLTDLQFDILRQAITISKNERVKKVSTLKTQLKEWYSAEDVEAAFEAWIFYSQEGCYKAKDCYNLTVSRP